MSSAPRDILWYQQITIDDVPLGGGKNASLGEMCRELTATGVKVLDGFAITAAACRRLLKSAGVDVVIRDILHNLVIRLCFSGTLISRAR